MNDGQFNFVSIILTVIGIIIAFYFSKDAKNSAKRSRDEMIASIYQKFAEGNLRDARSIVWTRVIPRWFRDKDFREMTIYYGEMRHHHLIESEIKDENDKIEEKLSNTLNDSYYISDLIDFYAYIYRIAGDRTDLLSYLCNQYFYHWWRGFLLSYALSGYSIWKSRCKTAEMRAQLPFHSNLELILKIDIEAMECPFNESEHIFYEKFKPDGDLYPGLKEHNQKLINFRRKRECCRLIRR